MRFTTVINNVKCLEWGLNANQGAVFDLFNQMASWAQATILDGVTYYWISRERVVEELPLYCQKTDTVYRYFKDFAEKGLIIYQKIGNQDLVSITEKGAEWNSVRSDLNPTLGNQSEQTRKSIRKSSDSNPTYKLIKNNNIKDQDTPLNPPVGETQGESVAVLDFLNDRLAALSAEVNITLPKFKPVPNTLKAIAARLKESSVADCQLVVDYLVARWGRDDKMRDYLSPKTIFRPNNFTEYLTKAQAWAANGKPVLVAGKWVNPQQAEIQASTPTVEEVKALYSKLLNRPSLFRSWQFVTLKEKALYYATIAVKNKRPLEREVNFVCRDAISDVMAKIDRLAVPKFD